jgi:hypothetical protein
MSGYNVITRKRSHILEKKYAMRFVKKILLPVDLSEVSPRIVSYVKEMAAKFEAEVHLPCRF